ncbi:Rrf2 family transcriptional regulator [Gluconobacter wancherniae]|uniref:RrF2 family transcriptional regulator n=1 Tax=Gluconobacter wancherniae TaxID=1307955 RepID=UPI001B8BB90F|nr:Rrf2 family transcriptional regulator [Gluconobacter wancherniae]MBS1062687.1 Rrf2 family transcriptional regulator [Gluconobacter wancherniae]
MRLTVHTDYALRTLIFLGTQPQTRVSIRDIAQAYGISENHLVKVVHRLGQGGFIHTMRGRGGGILLARDAKDICIGEVVRYTEDDMALVDCDGKNANGRPCALRPACVLRGALREALGAFLAVLDCYTLADLLTGQEAQLFGLLPSGELK